MINIEIEDSEYIHNSIVREITRSASSKLIDQYFIERGKYPSEATRILTEQIKELVEEHKEDIIEKAVNRVSIGILRSKAYKEKLKELGVDYATIVNDLEKGDCDGN